MASEELKCENCGMTFSKLEDLEKHMKEHQRAVELFRCEKCDITFHSNKELERHIKELHTK